MTAITPRQEPDAFPAKTSVDQPKSQSRETDQNSEAEPFDAPSSRFRIKPRVLTYDWTKNGGQVTGNLAPC
jgi:hypothetical protein